MSGRFERLVPGLCTRVARSPVSGPITPTLGRQARRHYANQVSPSSCFRFLQPPAIFRRFARSSISTTAQTIRSHNLTRTALTWGTHPQINDQTGGAVSLLTTSTFVVGTTAG